MKLLAVVKNHGMSLITFFGVDVDVTLRMRREDGSAIAGLYAAGEILGAGATCRNSFYGGMAPRVPPSSLGKSSANDSRLRSETIRSLRDRVTSLVMSRSPAWPKRKILGIALAMVSSAATVVAHPLGNFTVNRCAQIAVWPRTLVLTYTVDYAEIPAFQEIGRFVALSADLDPILLSRSPEARLLERELAQSWLKGLDLRIDGQPLAATMSRTALSFAGGSGGLPTMRLEIQVEAPLAESSASRIEYVDSNAPSRLGWREIFVNPLGARTVKDKSAPFDNRSDGLTEYPNDPAQALPQEISAAFTLEPVSLDPAALPGGPQMAPANPGLIATTTSPITLDRFVSLVRLGRSGEPLGASVVFGALLTAVMLGSFHALSPGHGKTIVGAYLVGSRGTAWHAIYLGAVVTFAHTVGVFALGLLTLLASRYVLPERLYPWLSFTSGALVALIGAMLFHERLEAALGVPREHRHLFWKHTPVTPSGADASAGIGLKGLTALGVSGGLVPCPSALLVLLAAVSLHRVAFGLALIVAFSLGLSTVLIALGLTFVYAAQRLQRFGSRPGVVNMLGVASALIVTLLGAAIAYGALVETGALRLAYGGR